MVVDVRVNVPYSALYWSNISSWVRAVLGVEFAIKKRFKVYTSTQGTRLALRKPFSRY